MLFFAAICLSLALSSCGDDPTVTAPQTDAKWHDQSGDAAIGELPVGADADATVDVADVFVCSELACDDHNACTEDSCDATSGCSNLPVPFACEDGNACTVNDLCANGNCQPGTALSCDDKNVCTSDACDLATGCTHTALEGPCDDGDGCTAKDLCQGGKCGSGAPLTCDDANPCSSDSCDPVAGCAFVANTSPCTDGNACTNGDACKDLACLPGESTICTDGNPCTDDACDGLSGVCLYAANTATCDDGDACTAQDGCAGAICAGQRTCACDSAAQCDDKNPCTTEACEGGACAYSAAAQGTACDDGNVCTAVDSCLGGLCLPGAATSCDDANPCTSDECLATLGCLHGAVAAPCDDGNAATLGDSCQAGLCVGLAASCTADVACNDGNDCSDDACVAGVCAHKPAGTGKPCSDGNGCTIGDGCQGGVCLPGAATNCDDANACTNDACNPTSGACIHSANSTPCDDGDACTTQDACAKGACSGPAQLYCEDGNQCTSDGCDAASGCTHLDNTLACDDGDVCTLGDACTATACVGGGPVDCDDNNVCTDDSCNVSSGCVHLSNEAPCDDGNACTLAHTCQGGICVGGDAPDCDDGNVCTDDVCVAPGGCVHTHNTVGCDDGNACTSQDACVAGQCSGGAAVSCDDANPCTNDGCDLALGCTHTDVANATVCGAPSCDGLQHSAAKTCFSGICLPGTKVACDDANVCTDDSCDAASGCSHAANAAPCDDGSKCTTADVCAGGNCLGGVPLNCGDQNACSVDSCDPQKGCEHVSASDGTPCMDASCAAGSYDKGSACSAGSCVALAAPLPCNDNNPCTQDLCAPTTGCVHVDNVAACDDGDACTSGDACLNGSCASGAAVLCADDGNPCTAHVCDKTLGCLVIDTTIPCDDKSVCSSSDTCNGGTCKGAAVSCDDQNPCTTDACDLATGCTHTDNAEPCNDGNPCTTGDLCGAGACKGAGGIDCDDGNPCTTDLCDPLDNGACKHSPAADGAACGNGACVAQGYQAPPVCTAGVCALPSMATQSCDDANVCTSDVCNAAQGCVHPAASGACDDGSACTAQDACSGGLCAGTAITCDDSNVCTDDGCQAKTGCSHALNTTPCSDGNTCTQKDQCANGTCIGVAVSCDDGAPCTIDSCSPASGCVHVSTAGPCSDGNACTTADTCVGGACVGGPAPTCNDGNSCTNDACDPIKGCVTTNNTALCDDGKPCTTADACAGGACVGGPALVCDDKNPCTIDSCDAAKGCVAVAGNNGQVCQAASCPTALTFAAAGTCLAGQCAVPAVKSCNDGIECTTDSCAAATGCANTTKPFGTPCTSASATLQDRFCAAKVCTGFEVTTTQGPNSTLSGLTSIDRPSGNYGIFVSGWNNYGGSFYGVVAGVVEATLATVVNGFDQNDIYYDVRNRLAVGGATSGQGAVAAVMSGGGNWSSANAPALNVTRPLYAVDRALVSNGDRYFFGGASDTSQPVWSTVGRVNRYGGGWGSVTHLAVADAPGGTCGQIAMEIQDIYAAADNSVFLAGPIYSGNNATKSVVAYYDGNGDEECGTAITGFDGVAYTSVAGTAASVLDIGTGVGAYGILRAIHGTSANHLLVGGSNGTLRSYDKGVWTTQTPVVSGVSIGGNPAFDVRSVFTTGIHGWAAGHYEDPLTKCRTVFALHGSFDAAAALWTWDKLWLASSSLMTCPTAGSTNLDATTLYKVWSDPNTASLYFVGSQGTDGTGKVVFSNATQIRQLLVRVKMQ